MKLIKAIKAVMAAGGAALVLYSVAISSVNRFGLENAALIIIGLVSVIYALFWHKISPYIKRGVPRILKYIFYSGIIIFIITFTVSLIAILFAANKKSDIKADAVIVLGCGLKGRTISLTLASRLDKAYECAVANPNAVIITSGGQGPGEDISEALAMKEYLKRKGIDENRILTEDASSNTKENMMLSKIVLDSYFNGSEYSAVVVTSDFHMLRSLEYARLMELNAQGLSSKCKFYFIPVYYMREYLALIKLFVFRL